MHTLICDHSGAVGYVASGLVLAAFGMKDITHLRVVAICSNFAFIAYGLALGLTPVWLLHLVLLPLNCWRLAEAFPVATLLEWTRPGIAATRLDTGLVSRRSGA